jgi:hypothetical protein
MKRIVLSAVAIGTLAISAVHADSASDIAEMKSMMMQMNQRLIKLEQENTQLRANQKKQGQEVKQAKVELAKVKSKPAAVAVAVPKTSTKKKKSITRTKVATSAPVAQPEQVDAMVEKYDKATPVFAKTSKLKFSGVNYLGVRERLTEGAFPGTSKTNETHFESRRNYFQVKGYFFENPKSYIRLTLDTFKDNFDPDVAAPDAKLESDGSWLVRLKYAYVWLDNIAPDLLPGTGVEIGQSHRPWIDYEEHHSFYYRSISKTFLESKNASDLTNSADIGVNVKTALPYFSSEFGVYNGEGYHANHDGHGVSLEWRTTAHILGTGSTGKDHETKVTYWDASFFGQYNMNNDKYQFTDLNGDTDGTTYQFFGLHTVYNQPSYLLAAQYVRSRIDEQGRPSHNNTDGWYKKNGEGYSLNATARFGQEYEYEVFGRYDRWEPKNANPYAAVGVPETLSTDNFIYGIAWQQNKNLKWLLNGITYRPDQRDGLDYAGRQADNFTDIMLTTQVHW